MIRFSVFYPNGDDVTFDHDYYRDVHVPMALGIWGLDSAQIDVGVTGPFIAAVHFLFDSMADFTSALSHEDSAKLTADVPNYTNSTPVRQISQVVP